MIQLSRNRDPNALPKDFVGDKLARKHLDLIERYFLGQTSGAPIKFSSAQWKNAKPALRRDTSGKCAYCEAPTAAVAHGDVEHFRPKSLYWWLAYCFDNYLYSCQICNQVYKGDAFPVARPRLETPVMPAAPPAGAALDALARTLARDATQISDAEVLAEWQVENADLVHPYFEDPADLFVYEVDDENEEVWIRAAPGARAARALAASNKYLGLNREDLRRQRYADYAVTVVLRAAHGNARLPAASKRQIEAEFARRTNAKFPFAGMHRFFLRSWGLFP